MRRATDSTRPASRAAARRLGALAAGTVLLAACGREGADPEGAAVVAAAPAPTAAPTSPAAPSPTIPTATTDRKPTTTDEKLRITTRPERSTTTTGRRPRTSTTTAAPAPAPPPPPPPPTVVLPQPIDPPDDAEAFEPVVPLGTLAIPEIGLQRTMYEGIRLPTFDLGPGHWPGSAMPGQQGNMIVGGHRTSGNADFRYLDALVPGDEMVVTTNDGAVYTYRVDGVEIVDPFALRILEQTPATTATLFACHPPGSIRERIVVHLTLA